MQDHRARLGTWFAATALIVAGCGDPAVSQVRGKVTVDGNALEKGTISFFPVDGKTQPAGGEINDGTYSVRVPAGVMTVKISAPKIVGKKKLYDKKDSREYAVTAEALPERYNTQTELKLDVTPGTLDKDWPLTSK
jgi:hypothetical protein